MVDITITITIVHGGYFMVYKPTFTSLGGAHPVNIAYHSLMDIQLGVSFMGSTLGALAAGMGHGCPVGWLASRWIERLRQLSICGSF